MKKTKNKTKICLSLLIAMAFILPSAAVFGNTSTDESTGIIDASEYNEPQIINQISTATTNPKIVSEDYESKDPIVSLDWNNGWPVQVESINIGSPIASGEYDIEATFCRPDYATSGFPVIVTDNVTEDDTSTRLATCDVLWKNKAAYGNTVSTVYAGQPFKIWFQSHDGNEMKAWVSNPIDDAVRWNLAGSYVQINRDIGGDGTADWAVRYYQDDTWDFWDGSTWGNTVPYDHGYNTVTNQMWVDFVGSDGSVAGWFYDQQAASEHHCVVPCDANRDSPNEWGLAWNDANVLNYLDGPDHVNLDLIITITSDCFDVFITFESTGETITSMDLDCGGFFVDSGYISGGALGTNSVTYTIPRSMLPVGLCNENGFLITYTARHGGAFSLYNCGTIEASVVEPAVAYDCGSAEIKKFLEIYKENKVPDVIDNLYCTDFEDPCEFYDEWATFDYSPDWGNNGAIDTWTWTDKRANSPTHSFHSTAGDTYLMNQHDALEFNMDTVGLYMGNETDVIYSKINISWAQFMEGDSIIVEGTRLIQDGGYVQVAFSDGTPAGYTGLTWQTVSEVFYDTAGGWEEEFVDNITVNGNYLFVRFVFFSDAAFCYEGWYIDDFCVDGIQQEFGEWEFVTDSHSHEQIMEGQCIDHTFIESWFAEEGTYKICVWLQTLDECHYAVHGSDIFGDYQDVNDAYCIIVNVTDCLDYEAQGLTFDPETPAWEGDDVEICATTYNGGTIDGLDAQVQVTVQYGASETVMDNSFDCETDKVTIENWEDYGEMWHQSAKGVTYYDWEEDPLYSGDDNVRSWWHFTELAEDPDNCILTNIDDEGKTDWPMGYGVWNPDPDYAAQGYGPGEYPPSEWINTPMGLIEAADASLSVTVEFDCAWALPDTGGSTDWVIAIGDDSAGVLNFYDNAFDPYSADDNDEFLSNGDGSWKHIGPIPVSPIIQFLIDGGSTGASDTDLTVMWMMHKDRWIVDSGIAWSGMKIDNVVIKKLVIQEDPILFQETKVIDNTEDYPENNFNVSEYNTTCFTWPDVGVGRYIITQTVMGDTCDLTNNTYITGYDVINYEQDFDDGEIEFIDNTCTGDGHWQVDDCCGGSFWCGDYETTMYGEFYDDCLYIAPYDEDLDEQNRTQDYGGKLLNFTTWYQINATDDIDNFTGDWAIVEFSNDGGLHWFEADSWNGVSSPTPEPDGEADWVFREYLIDAGVDQIRFRFMSDNDTVENRGWMLDNIFIDGIIDDECEDMENFETEVKCYGNWWKSPSIYWDVEGMCCLDAMWHHYWYYDFYVALWGPPIVTYWEYYFGAYEGCPCVSPDLTYGCYDMDRQDMLPEVPWPCWGGDWGNGTIECYPQDINNTFKWTFPVDGCFWGYIDGGFVSDVAEDDQAVYEFSADGGAPEVMFSPADVAGTMYSAIGSEYLGDELAVMVTMISGDEDHGTWDGITLQDWVFHGMKDNNAPTSTVAMSGTFDDVYKYYTSAVSVTITAADDVSGIAATYYELDGTQQTYTGPFTVSGNGEHTLCYWSVDNEGNVEDKKCVAPFRIDTAGPSVSINIEPGIYLFGNKLLSSEKYIFLFGGVPMTATASADGAPLKTVEFYINDVLFAEDTTSPFAAMCREKNTGGATFKVIAEDVLGQTATATQVVDTYIKIL